MSRKKREVRKWWQMGSDDYQMAENEGLFSNSIKQHQRKFDEDGVEIHSYDYDYDYSDRNFDNSVESPYKFDWGLEKKLTDNSYKSTNAERYSNAQNDYNSQYSSGSWQGYSYYRKESLSYKYVQQMANALAAQHRITVKVGNEWKVDLENKTLTYNPSSLMMGTKSELLATLMHEIGKLRYCEHISKITDKYLAFYEQPVRELFSIFEDVRADYLMLKAYESASEIYESAIPFIDKKIDTYRVFARTFSELLPNNLQKLYDNFESQKDIQQKEALLLKYFRSKDETFIQQKIDDIRTRSQTKGNIYDYCGEILQIMYDTENHATHKYENIEKKVEETEDYIEPAKKQNSSQENMNFLSKEIFPKIESLLKSFSVEEEEFGEFPSMSDEAKYHLKQMMSEQLQRMLGGGRKNSGVNTDEEGNSKVRNSGPSGNNIPPEWANGDYGALKESVSSDINALVNKLTFLRREEMSVKYQADQKRGKINSRKLYKHATGNNRIFKAKLPNLNTVQSFAFSLLIDVSGSMMGSRIIHTARATTILSEVFKKLDVPFELVAFGDGPKTLKSFSQSMGKDIEGKIGGMIKHLDGGTNMDRGLERLHIEQRPEHNRVVVVLSDGGVGGMGVIKELDDKYFKPMADKNILSVGFGIECEDQMQHLCLGNSKVLSNANELPIEFSNLIKTLIKKKGK